VSKYTCIRFRKQGFQDVYSNGKTYRGFASQREHNRREEEMDNHYLKNPHLMQFNISKDYIDVNTVKEQYQKILSQHKKRTGRSMNSMHKPFINGLITFSPGIEFDLNLYEEENREKLVELIHDFLIEEIGNVVSIDLHLCETTAHIHFCSFNYHKNKSRSYAELITEEIKSSDIRQNQQQDRLVSFLKENIQGYNYERGKLKSKKSYLSERAKNWQHLQEQEEELQKNQKEILGNFFEAIQEIKTNAEPDDLADFERLLMRYLKSDNVEKISKLIKKHKKIIKKNNKGIKHGR
jgi:hypothetical protein